MRFFVPHKPHTLCLPNNKAIAGFRAMQALSFGALNFLILIYLHGQII